MRIRRATGDDAAGIANVFRASIAATELPAAAKQAWSAKMDVYQARANLHSPAFRCWVAEDRICLGYAARRADVLEMVYVHPLAWNRRVASRLIGFVEADARRTRIGKLTVRASPFLRPLLEARGYEFVAEEGVDLGGHTLRVAILVKVLPMPLHPM